MNLPWWLPYSVTALLSICLHSICDRNHSNSSHPEWVCFFTVSRRTVRNWLLKYRSGRIEHHNGIVQVQISGYYYVYSQMFYHDGTPHQMSHQLFVNRHKFLESTSAVVNEARKYNTNYNGGVVFLNATDRIFVRTPFSTYYYMNPSSSYFGAFLLHHTTRWPFLSWNWTHCPQRLFWEFGDISRLLCSG